MDVRRKMLMKKTSSGGSGGDYNYMTIYALEDGLQAKLSGNTVSYSIDEGTTWNELASDTFAPTVNNGQTIMFKASLTPNSSKGIGTFYINKRCILMGNCMSLLFGDDADSNSLSGKDYAFYKLFADCTTIIQVSDTFLPATILADRCYYNMFHSCTSLTTAPELPATILADRCYYSMFQNCTSLLTAPELPATTLAYYCYRYMFYGCTRLITAPELPATTLAPYCYQYMFQSCTRLTTAPELPAITLVSNCYYRMFYGCSKLNYIKMLATDISASNCLNAWVQNVSSTGTFVKNPAMTSLPTGNSGIPRGWTVVDDN
jgi:hypothetical protein